jgi:hypothetical protein
MITKVDIPSIRCNMSFREPKSMRNVDGLSLLFIDFYVLALTPRLSSTETSLQLSENITPFAVYHIVNVFGCLETRFGLVIGFINNPQL